MKKIHIKSIIMGVAALFASAGANAGDQSGLYLGAGLGDTNIVGSQDLEDLEFDSTGYKLILGYNFGLLPLLDLGVEGAYVNLGEEKSGSATFQQTSLNGFGIAGLSFGPIGLFAKAGFASWDAKTQIGRVTIEESGTDPVYGLGARFSLGSLILRLEYEEYDQSEFDDVSMVSASALYMF